MRNCDFTNNSVIQNFIFISNSTDQQHKVLEFAYANKSIYTINNESVPKKTENIIVEKQSIKSDNKLILKNELNINNNMEIVDDNPEGNLLTKKPKILLTEINKNDDELLEAIGIETSITPPKFDYANFYADQLTGSVNINFGLIAMNDIAIRIIDANGKSIFYEMQTGFEGEYNQIIDLKSHNKGAYFMQINQGKQSLVRKIILE